VHQSTSFVVFSVADPDDFFPDSGPDPCYIGTRIDAPGTNFLQQEFFGQILVTVRKNFTIKCNSMIILKPNLQSGFLTGSVPYARIQTEPMKKSGFAMLAWLSGHVLVSPLRKVARFIELTSAEVADLFQTVQKVDSFITGYYGTPGSTITIQGEIIPVVT
jgi:hypothetical protein